MTPTFQGETQFAGYADSSKGGPRITLRLADREALEAFVGAEGQRFACVLVRIGDDEQAAPPVKAPKAEPAKRGDGDHLWSKWLALRCKDPRFWQWIEAREAGCSDATLIECEADAVNWVRDQCEVASRSEIDTDPAARERFMSRIKGPWHRHFIAQGWTE